MKMSMIDSMVMLWSSPSLFKWDMLHYWNIFISRS